MAEATLKTRDNNQNRLTELLRADPEPAWFKLVIENWSVVAVTPEKKVAMVVMFRYLVVALFSALWIGGKARARVTRYE